jgi:hypothetical protein
MPVAAFAALLTLALAACTPSQPTPSPTPTSAPTPLFSSDAAALKAATEAYAAYLKMSDTISHDGGADPERIKPYVTDSVYSSLKSDFDGFAKSGRRSSGSTHFRDVRLERFSGASLYAYLCSDVSDVRVLDANGVVVTPASRQAVLALAVEFEKSNARLRIAQSKVWSGKSFC